MPTVLVIEKTGDIQALLRKQFLGDPVFVDAVPVVEAAAQKFMTEGYDVLIWDAIVSKTEQSKGLELLDLLTKDSSRTYIITVTDQEAGSLSLDRLKAYAHRTLTRPVDGDEICTLVTEALQSANLPIRLQHQSRDSYPVGV